MNPIEVDLRAYATDASINLLSEEPQGSIQWIVTAQEVFLPHIPCLRQFLIQAYVIHDLVAKGTVLLSDMEREARRLEGVARKAENNWTSVKHHVPTPSVGDQMITGLHKEYVKTYKKPARKDYATLAPKLAKTLEKNSVVVLPDDLTQLILGVQALSPALLTGCISYRQQQTIELHTLFKNLETAWERHVVAAEQIDKALDSLFITIHPPGWSFTTPSPYHLRKGVEWEATTRLSLVVLPPGTMTTEVDWKACALTIAKEPDNRPKGGRNTVEAAEILLKRADALSREMTKHQQFYDQFPKALSACKAVQPDDNRWDLLGEHHVQLRAQISSTEALADQHTHLEKDAKALFCFKNPHDIPTNELQKLVDLGFYQHEDIVTLRFDLTKKIRVWKSKETDLNDSWSSLRGTIKKAKSAFDTLANTFYPSILEKKYTELSTLPSPKGMLLLSDFNELVDGDDDNEDK